MRADALVVKANRLVQASYRLDLVEQRVMQMAIAWSRTHVEELDADTWVELSVGEYAALYQTDQKSAYRQLQQAAKSLRQRTLMIEVFHEITGEPAILETGWVSYIMYVPNSGLIRIRFSQVIVPCISRLEEQFTSFKLNEIIGLTSAYAIRLYELLKQYQSIKRRDFGLKELREYLEATEVGYDRIDNFKSRVVDKAVEQINLHTDLNISYATQKSGRTVIGFVFSIHQKTKKALLIRDDQSARSAAAVVGGAGLSIAENSMLKELSALTGRSNVELLLEARAAVGEAELFLWLDTQLRAAKTA